ncbi:hypothetical protein ACHAWF_005552 [Thalassiosira exigua]
MYLHRPLDEYMNTRRSPSLFPLTPLNNMTWSGKQKESLFTSKFSRPCMDYLRQVRSQKMLQKWLAPARLSTPPDSGAMWHDRLPSRLWWTTLVSSMSAGSTSTN